MDADDEHICDVFINTLNLQYVYCLFIQLLTKITNEMVDGADDFGVFAKTFIEYISQILSEFDIVGVLVAKNGTHFDVPVYVRILVTAV